MTKHADRGVRTGSADLTFPKVYYNGDFTTDNFESLNQLGNLNQSLNQQLHNEEFALRQFQMAAAAAQQNAAVAATTTAAYAASGYPTATATVNATATANAVANNVVNQIGIGNTALSQLNFFQRSFQRNFGENMHSTLRNGNDRVTAGFNMITPLENIKHFNQNSAAAATNFQ